MAVSIHSSYTVVISLYMLRGPSICYSWHIAISCVSHDDIDGAGTDGEGCAFSLLPHPSLDSTYVGLQHMDKHTQTKYIGAQVHAYSYTCTRVHADAQNTHKLSCHSVRQ